MRKSGSRPVPGRSAAMSIAASGEVAITSGGSPSVVKAHLSPAGWIVQGPETSASAGVSLASCSRAARYSGLNTVPDGRLPAISAPPPPRGADPHNPPAFHACLPLPPAPRQLADEPQQIVEAANGLVS